MHLKTSSKKESFTYKKALHSDLIAMLVIESTEKKHLRNCIVS